MSPSPGSSAFQTSSPDGAALGARLLVPPPTTASANGVSPESDDMADDQKENTIQATRPHSSTACTMRRCQRLRSGNGSNSRHECRVGSGSSCAEPLEWELTETTAAVPGIPISQTCHQGGYLKMPRNFNNQRSSDAAGRGHQEATGTLLEEA